MHVLPWKKRTKTATTASNNALKQQTPATIATNTTDTTTTTTGRQFFRPRPEAMPKFWAHP
jgi:hypothetical protein